jgi:hypothetical protein
VSGSDGPAKRLAAPSANDTDTWACPCSNSIRHARLVGPASMAPGTCRPKPAWSKERNWSRFRLTHSPVSGLGRIFSTDVAGCSPAR